MVQVMVSTAMILICGQAGVQTLLFMNNKALAMRIMSNARAVVQRNIDTAMNVPYTSTSVPSILATNSSSASALGNVYNETTMQDASGATSNILLSDSGTTLLTGTLYRNVTAETYSDSTNTTIIVRRVTFTMNYNLRGRAYSFSITTLRSVD
jgi:hypothetical protein